MKYSVLVSSILAAVLLIGSTSCLVPPSPTPGPPQVSQTVKSDKQRITSPVASQSDLTALVKGNNVFALNAFQKIKKDDNLFFSPYSISVALAMTYAGARDSTERQMADTLNFTLP